ncbi:MAG TPA: VWA domain-containing protein, partial [Fimbriimonadaceae bacterium]|nr:VWA domain-containing protein [Fimbriimonadaceae bacterium]
DEIPNRDFILKWTPAGNGVTEGLITDSEGSFCLTVLPPRGDVEQYAAPREVDFVIDQSGSQEGYPLAKSKELTLAMIDKLRPDDVFNIVTFTTSVNKLWPEPVPNTPERVNEAKQFVRGLTAGGGTDLLPPLKETMSAPANDGRTKIVVFNSDGYVGDDFNVLAMVHKNQANARLFTFGIGDSVNRFLIDQMSAEGRGDSEIVTLASDADPAVARFLKRTQTPILTDVTVTATGTVHDLTPNPVPDLFADRPLLIFGRYDKSGAATVTIGGRLNGQPWSRTIDIDFPATENSGDGVTKVWARRMLDDMVRQDWIAATRTVTRGQEPTTDDSRYADFALKYGIMSQWTSFVAVEKRVVNIGGVQRTVRVPVEMAEGVSYDGVFGRAGTGLVISNSQNGPTVTIHGKQGTTTGGGGGTTGGGGFGGGGAAVQYNRAQAVDRLKAPSDKSAHPELKIHKDLRDKKKGTFEVQILLHDLPEEWDKALKDAGLEIADSDKGLKVVFGTVEAKHLMDLAKLDFVDQILPLDGS